MGDANPWIVGHETPALPTPAVEVLVASGPTQPQYGVPEVESTDRLQRRWADREASVWWVGAHGGAGESTLRALDPSSAAAGHAWPVAADSPGPRVVLVARSSATGLLAAQRAATEWASRSLPPMQLLGLVIIADAPGRLPKPLRDLAARVAGAVPHVWHLPWVESWRLGEPVTLGNAPREAHKLLADLAASPR